MKWLMAIPVWSTPRDSLNRFNLVFSRCPYEESPLGLSFFVLNYPWPDGADEINIPRCRGGYLYNPPAAAGGIVNAAFLRGASLFAFNYPSRCRGRDSKDCLPAGPFSFLRLIIPGLTARDNLVPSELE